MKDFNLPIFILLAILLHTIFLFSIFDIYFKSPILHGVGKIESPQHAPAKRVIVFVADGLRADKFYEVDANENTRAPFLRNIILTSGVWGVSHTVMPSESRPGHVAIFSGFFEDVSAVTKGWKENPVEFDSVFNESHYSWAWGSSDILPMFKKGITDGHMSIDCYPSTLQEYGQDDSSILDSWVFDKVTAIFQMASTDIALRSKLNADKIILFLHLLATDVLGHTHKPYSLKYLNNIEILDQKIEKLVNEIEHFYNHDGKTAYIFTSDHGMTDWGSHGAGSQEETMLPFVAWGAGFRGPLGSGRDNVADGWDKVWHLDHKKRVDIKQIDIAPLISILIGIPIPVNSVGILPVKMLGTDWSHKLDSMITNANQILNQYHHLRDMIKNNRFSIFYSPFKELSSNKKKEYFDMVNILQSQKRYQDSIQVTSKIISVALKGLEYYQKYDRYMLKLAISFSFLGWIAYIICLIGQVNLSEISSLENPFHDSSKSQQSNYHLLFAAIIILIFTMKIQSMPFMYYVYFLCPIILWNLLWSKRIIYYKIFNLIQKDGSSCIGTVFLTIIGLEILVLAFTFRQALSVGLIFMAIWPYFAGIKTASQQVWTIMAVLSAIFPLLPVVGREANYDLVLISGMLVLAIGAITVKIMCKQINEKIVSLNDQKNSKLYDIKDISKIKITHLVQLAIITCATFLVKASSDSIHANQGLPFFNQFLSWVILIISPFIPFFTPTSVLPRLHAITFSLFAPYILLTTNYETFFFLSLSLLLTCWVFLEQASLHPNKSLFNISFSLENDQSKMKRGFEISDVRRAYFFLFFIILAFFGTGNIASLNSFEVSSVFCFITIFNPFVMSGLILVKIMLPFLAVACFLRTVTHIRGSVTALLFLIIMLMADFMALHFFFQVRDSGSWLDIGTSISHYVIIMTMTIFMLALYGLATVYTSASGWTFNINSKSHVF